MILEIIFWFVFMGICYCAYIIFICPKPRTEKEIENHEEFNRCINEEDSVIEKEIRTFVKDTPDFDNYNKDIWDWFCDHPRETDIRIAYNAVKKIEKSNPIKAGKDNT